MEVDSSEIQYTGNWKVIQTKKKHVQFLQSMSPFSSKLFTKL